MGFTERTAVVTGIGMVTPLGPDLASTVAALSRGDRAVAPAFAAEGKEGWRIARVDGFDPRPHFRIPKALKLTDRRTRMAVAAASMAIEDARLCPGDLDPGRLGVIVGSSGSDLQADELGRATADGQNRAAGDIAYFSERVLSDLNPLWLLVNLPNMVSAHIAIQLDARGPNSMVMTDWIAGLQAIEEAAEWVRAGEADAVLAGGAECGVLPFVMSSYDQAGLLAPGDDGSPGLALADGAAILLIEEERGATARGARIHGEVLPPCRTSGQENTIVSALTAIRDEIRWRDLPLLAVSGAGGPPRMREDADGNVLVRVFGDGEPRDRAGEILDFRGALGHALAASGAIDAGLMLARLASADGPGAVVCNARGFLGQSATLAFLRRAA